MWLFSSSSYFPYCYYYYYYYYYFGIFFCVLYQNHPGRRRNFPLQFAPRMLVGLFLSPAQQEINRPFPNNSSLRKEEEEEKKKWVRHYLVCSVRKCGTGGTVLSSEFRVSWLRFFWFIWGGWTASRKIINPWVAFWDIIVTNCNFFLFRIFFSNSSLIFGGFRSN